MSKDNNGGPAFPIRGDRTDWNASGGMSLRDWFAGQASHGAADSICDVLDGNDEPTAIIHARRHARAAHIVADAMLAEREK